MASRMTVKVAPANQPQDEFYPLRVFVDLTLKELRRGSLADIYIASAWIRALSRAGIPYTLVHFNGSRETYIKVIGEEETDLTDFGAVVENIATKVQGVPDREGVDQSNGSLRQRVYLADRFTPQRIAGLIDEYENLYTGKFPLKDISVQLLYVQDVLRSNLQASGLPLEKLTTVENAQKYLIKHSQTT